METRSDRQTDGQTYFVIFDFEIFLGQTVSPGISHATIVECHDLGCLAGFFAKQSEAKNPMLSEGAYSCSVAL